MKNKFISRIRKRCYKNELPDLTKYRKQIPLVSKCLLKGIKKIICLFKFQNNNTGQMAVKKIKQCIMGK